MGTRLRVGLIGQEMGFSLLRVDLGADEATIRTEKLGVSVPEPRKMSASPSVPSSTTDDRDERAAENDDTILYMARL